MAREHYGKHGRCEATAKSTDERCGQPAEGDHGKCRYHGGKSPRGEESPNFKHGLFSDHLSEEDREVIEILEEYDDAEKMDDLINWRLARLRRAVRALNDQEEERDFWAAFRDVIHATGEVEAAEIKELAGMLAKGNQAMQHEIDLVRKLIKDRNKIAEGEDVNLGWREMLAGGDS